MANSKLVMVWVLALGLTWPGDAGDPPNVVIIYAEDIGYGDLGCYGGEIPTPNIDAMAKGGLKFTNGYCPSATCTPSRFAMLTGQYAFRQQGHTRQTRPVGLVQSPPTRGALQPCDRPRRTEQYRRPTPRATERNTGVARDDEAALGFRALNKCHNPTRVNHSAHLARVIITYTKGLMSRALTIRSFPTLSLTLLLSLACSSVCLAKTIYVDSQSGSDTNNGRTAKTAFQTLERVNRVKLQPGDEILLKRGSRFKGALKYKQIDGIAERPITIGAYGDERLEKPLILGQGHLACIDLVRCSHWHVDGLELRSDGGRALVPAAANNRYGVRVHVYEQGKSEHIKLTNLTIKNIYATKMRPSEGRNGQTSWGHGIFVDVHKESAGHINHIHIEGCEIENVGYFGIWIRGQKGRQINHVKILNNTTLHTGGSGILVAFTKDVLIKGNTTNFSGSRKDKRMHMRGSGSWTFASDNVLYEENTFMNARGLGDSAGVHIDFACSNVVIQRCLSYNNAGGFVEILGDNFNCCYRYNISVNDGARVKGKDGAKQEGKILWTSGHCMDAPQGPTNSYIYNNTIYTKKEIVGKFSFVETTSGIVIANNIFHVLGETKYTGGDQISAAQWQQNKQLRERFRLDRIQFENNLYLRRDILPAESILQDVQKRIGNARFESPGGRQPEGYIPTNVRIVRDKGIVVQTLPEDEGGLMYGPMHTKDFFGNPIQGKPDLGAIELQ